MNVHPVVKNSLIRYEVRPPAAWITLNRADKRNALSRQLIDELLEAVARAGDDERVRCLVLAAAGPVFCAGMDLNELRESLTTPPHEEKRKRGERQKASRGAGERGTRPLSPAPLLPISPSSVWDDALRLARLYDALYMSPKPTLALVQGPAVAGGAGLVTVCDLALATPEARFGYPEVRRGLVAAMVMPHLLRHVGERLARYLLLTGELIDAAQARHLGLINEVVPSEKLLARADALVSSLAEGGPNALAQTKAFLHQFSRQALSLADAAKGSAAPRLSQECQDGLRAFFDKKPVPWAKK